MRRVLAKESHDRLVPKLLHIRLDLLEEIHGRNMNCPCDVAACAVFTAKVDHNHILLIPKLGHTKEIQRMQNLAATKHRKTITSDVQTNMRESLGTQDMHVKPTGTTKQIDKNLKILKKLCSQNVLKSTGCMPSTPASLGTWPSIRGSSFRCGVVTFMESSCGFGRPVFGFWCPEVLWSGAA